jgi:DNA polymerase III subunit epsilon
MSGRPANAPTPPPRSLRRRSWRLAEFASLDFETTGLDHERDAIVSFGVVPVRTGRIPVGASLHRLVVPAVPSSPGSMKIHGILPRDLEEAESLDVAAEALARALEGRFVLAWYASVEIGFLVRLYGKRAKTWARRTVDVRQMAIALERLDPDMRHGLTSTAERYGVPVARPHEALDDALVTAQLFLVLASKLEPRGFGSTKSLLRLTRLS